MPTGPNRPISPNNPTINGANGNPTAVSPQTGTLQSGQTGAGMGTNSPGMH
jgi:hypothetical protein